MMEVCMLLRRAYDGKEDKDSFLTAFAKDAFGHIVRTFKAEPKSEKILTQNLHVIFDFQDTSEVQGKEPQYAWMRVQTVALGEDPIRGELRRGPDGRIQPRFI